LVALRCAAVSDFVTFFAYPIEGLHLAGIRCQPEGWFGEVGLGRIGMAGPPCGGPVHCVLTCAGFGARSFRVARYRRRNTAAMAATGIAGCRAGFEGKARGSGGSGFGAGAQMIACRIGTIGFGERPVRTGQGCPAGCAVRRW